MHRTNKVIWILAAAALCTAFPGQAATLVSGPSPFATCSNIGPVTGSNF